MARTVDVPPELRHDPFTVAVAARLGIGRTTLRGPRFRRLFRGVYVAVDVVLSHVVWLQAVLLVLPAGTVVSGVSAARLWGFDPRGFRYLELTTTTALRSTLPGVVLRRHEGRIVPRRRDGLPVTDPDRTFVDCARTLGLVQLVQLAEHLLHTGATTFDGLVAYCLEHHLHGVRRARRALRWVVEGAESPMESLVRLLLVFARLPTPVCNIEVRDGGGRFVARVDMLYARYRVVVEYDGWQHERDARQRRHDIGRRERLEALGYRIIVVSIDDLKAPRTIVDRVHVALVQRGYRGPSPVTSDQWHRMFTR